MAVLLPPGWRLYSRGDGDKEGARMVAGGANAWRRVRPPCGLGARYGCCDLRLARRERVPATGVRGRGRGGKEESNATKNRTEPHITSRAYSAVTRIETCNSCAIYCLRRKHIYASSQYQYGKRFYENTSALKVTHSHLTAVRPTAASVRLHSCDLWTVEELRHVKKLMPAVKKLKSFGGNH